MIKLGLYILCPKNKQSFAPQEGPTTRRRTDRSVSSPCRRLSSCLCSSYRSPPTRIDLGPWSGRPCREAPAAGFVVRASLDFSPDVQLDQQLVACQTKGSPWFNVQNQETETMNFRWCMNVCSVFTFSLSQTSSFDSRTKCLFSSSRNALRPCSLWNETIAQPYLNVRLVNSLNWKLEWMLTSLRPRCYLACSWTSESCLDHSQARIGSHGKTWFKTKLTELLKK